MAVNHYFEIFSNDGSTTLFTSANTVNGDTIITVTETGLTIGTETYSYSGTKKFVGVSFSENSTSPDLAIGESFDGNTAYVYIVEEALATNGVTIEYNGSTIASLESGQTATLACSGKKMKSDIVVTAPESSGGGSSPSDSRDYNIICYSATKVGLGKLTIHYVLFSENPTKVETGAVHLAESRGRNWLTLNKGDKIAFRAYGDGFEYIKCESLGINITTEYEYTEWIELTEDLFDLKFYSYVSDEPTSPPDPEPV